MDLTEISALVGLATNAVGLTGKATATVSQIKELFDGEGEGNDKEALKLLNGLAVELTSANMTNVDLSSAIKALSTELQKQDNFATEVARYELFETREKNLIYRLKESEAKGEPIHYICPVCLKRDRLISYVHGSGDFKNCQTDRKHVYRFENTPSKPIRMF